MWCFHQMTDMMYFSWRSLLDSCSGRGSAFCSGYPVQVSAACLALYSYPVIVQISAACLNLCLDRGVCLLFWLPSIGKCSSRSPQQLPSTCKRSFHSPLQLPSIDKCRLPSTIYLPSIGNCSLPSPLRTYSYPVHVRAVSTALHSYLQYCTCKNSLHSPLQLPSVRAVCIHLRAACIALYSYLVHVSAACIGFYGYPVHVRAACIALYSYPV